MLLLPEALEDYIAPENPVRFIDAFVANSICKRPASPERSCRRPGGRPTIRRSAPALSLWLLESGAFQSWPGTGSGAQLGKGYAKCAVDRFRHDCVLVNEHSRKN